MNTASDLTLSLSEWAQRWRHREPNLLVHDPGGPRECLVRSGELVVPADALPAALDRLERWVEKVEPVESAKLATLRLRGGVGDRCVQLATELADRVPVAANHVHIGAPVLVGAPILMGTGTTADSVPPPPAPPDLVWDPPVTVALLDSGLDPHPWFAGRPWLSAWGLQPEVLDADGDDLADRQAGHGTFVAGVLLQHAPGVTVRHRRVLSSQGLSDDRTVAAALRAVRQRAAAAGEHLDVVLLTAGCHTVDDRCPPLLARELSRFTDAVFVAAAGNGATDRPFWPAADPAVLAVGATDSARGPAPFSNHGPWVDAVAPGVDVVSSHVRFTPAERGVAPDTEAREYGAARWSGTSFAAPAIAAHVAVLRRAGVPAAAARRLTRTRFHPGSRTQTDHLIG